MSRARAFRPFAEAREFVRSLLFQNTKQLQLYSKSAEESDDIPNNPFLVFWTEFQRMGDWPGENGCLISSRLRLLQFYLLLQNQLEQRTRAS